MQWNNVIQGAILKEWTREVQKAEGPRAKQILRRQIAVKYGLTVNVVQGIIELGATQGMIQVGGGEMQGGRRYEPVNYHKLVGDLKDRVEALERKFNYLLEGIERVVEDGETMRVHVHQLRGMSRWMKDRKVIDLEDRPLRLK